MKIRYIAKGSTMTCIHGKEYEVLSVEKGWYRIIDESGEDYLYPPSAFEVVEKDNKKPKAA
ncbi:MAG: hypothetical protein IJU05_05100 [Schwartzia sp.]|nr:hypothetical protein [Schwartzia sp. (in: firmicutes)]